MYNPHFASVSPAPTSYIADGSNLAWFSTLHAGENKENRDNLAIGHSTCQRASCSCHAWYLPGFQFSVFCFVGWWIVDCPCWVCCVLCVVWVWHWHWHHPWAIKVGSLHWMSVSVSANIALNWHRTHIEHNTPRACSLDMFVVIFYNWPLMLVVVKPPWSAARETWLGEGEVLKLKCSIY